MATMTSISVVLSNRSGASLPAQLSLRVYTPRDGRARALRWGGAVLLVSLLMLPIPIVHFGVVPLVLIGMPLVSFVVYRVYSSGTDLIGRAPCPSCQAPQDLQAAAGSWPLHRVCQACREPFEIAKAQA